MEKDEGDEAVRRSPTWWQPPCPLPPRCRERLSPGAAICLAWLARGVAVRLLPNEARRMAPGSAGCGGGRTAAAEPATKPLSLVLLPPLLLPHLLSLQRDPGRGSIPWRPGRRS